jgi:Fic family protein
MAYIYKKIIGKRPYYYLRVSKREGEKVITKDIAYLSNDISKIQKQLDKLPLKYKKEIRKSHKNIKKFIDSHYYLDKVKKLKSDPYFNIEVLKKIEAIRLHYFKEFSKLDNKTKEEVFRHFLIDFAYNTTSIEGNTITLEEAEKLLKENLTPKEKTPREIFDLQNTQKVFFYLLENRPKFSQKLVITIHDMLLENIDLRKGYRDKEIRVFQSHFKTSPGKYVKTDMDILFKWFEKYNDKLHPLVLASLFHQKFEKIHPFFDGNGRTGRIVMNYMLILNKYPPLIIQKKKRSAYLQALSTADKSDFNDIEPKYFKKLINYIASEMIESYWNNFNS